MRRRIVLSGFMGTGKTTVGPRLAARLGVGFVDADEEIAREAGRSIPEIFRDEGEVAFRAREARVVARLLAETDGRVIALGGGAVTNRRLRQEALDRAIVVTLAARPETILERVGSKVAERPLLSQGGDPLGRVRDLLEQRAEAYAECHGTLSTEGVEPDAIVDAIVALAERAAVVVPLGLRTYVVDVGADGPARLTDAIARWAPSSIVVVTDAHVQRDRHAYLDTALAGLAVRHTTVTLPAGEEHKTLASVATIWDAALGAGIDRDALVVGYGGGVVGDLAGFAASALLRGVRSVIAPTTLLSMVDASVGGKTGFDHPTGKNLLGAFHQPSGVVVDLAHLSTLPARERVAGLAEIVKVAVATDLGLFELLERNASALARGDVNVLLPVTRRAIEAKVRVVRDDERERGRRALLNLGHTVGHALEAHGHYRKHLHGEAVALGTVSEMRAAARLGYTPSSLAIRVGDLFAQLGLPVRIGRAEVAAAWPFVATDKKRVLSRIQLPVVTAPGEARVEAVEAEVLKAAVLAGLE